MFGSQNKPAFGTSLFGTSNTGFGQTSTSFGQASTAAGGGLFGARPTVSFATPQPQQQTLGLFGATSTPVATAGTLFGASTAAPATGTSMFGQVPTSAFAQTTTPANTGGLFGSSIQSQPLIGTAFGTGVANTGATSLFGNTTQVPVAGGMFGAQPTAAGTSLFGQAAVVQPMANGTGAVKFNPPLGQDTMMKNNQQTTINTKHHCITAMKEYEMKSFEELRVDDYLAGRKGPQQQQTATGLFGAAAPLQPAAPTVGTSLFGGVQQQQPASTAPGASLFSFGSSAAPTATTQSLFSTATQPAATGGLFGGAATNVVRPLFGAATTTTQSTGFSFGAPTAATPGASLFGSALPQPQPSLFGATATSQPQTSAFGTAATGTGFSFGGTGASIFSKPTAAPAFVATTAAPAGGLFQTQQPFSGFGAASQPQQAAGLFGAKPTTTPAFGGFGAAATSTAPAFGAAFGAVSSAAPAFGGAGGLFGTATQQQRPLFGGATAAPAFGATAPGAVGLFAGAPNQATVQQPLFGGATATQPSLFGVATSKPLFGGAATATQPPAFTGFGGTATNLFGAPAIGQTPMMGAAQQFPGLGTDPNAALQQAMLQQQALAALIQSPYGDVNLFKNILPTLAAKREAQMKPTNPMMQKSALNSSLSAAAPLSSLGLSFARTISPLPLTRQPQRLIPMLSRKTTEKNSLLFDDDITTSELTLKQQEGFVPKRNLKRLVIKPKSSMNANQSLPVTAGDTSGVFQTSFTGLDDSQAITTRRGVGGNASFMLLDSPRGESRPSSAPIPRLNLNQSNLSHSNLSQTKMLRELPVQQQQQLEEEDRFVDAIGDVENMPVPPSTMSRSDLIEQSSIIRDSGELASGSGQLTSSIFSPPRVAAQSKPAASSTPFSAAKPVSQKPVEKSVSPAYDNLSISPKSNLYPGLVTSAAAQRRTDNDLPTVDEEEMILPEPGLRESEPHIAGIVLTRPEYYTEPSLDELADLTDKNGECVVTKGFRVGRLGYGSVYWPGELHVSNLNLDEIVRFRHKEVTVYPDDDTKPPVGCGLNRTAEVTLERVWPNDKTTHLPIKSPQRLTTLKYREKLERATAQLGASFIDYRPETGSWVFKVPHFSKYGLDDEADEEEPTPMDLAVSQQRETFQKTLQHLKSPKMSSLNGQVASTSPVVGQGQSVEDSDVLLIDNTTDYDKRQLLADESCYTKDDMGSGSMDVVVSPISSTKHLSAMLGIRSEKVDAMRSAFFDHDGDRWQQNLKLIPKIAQKSGIFSQLMDTTTTSDMQVTDQSTRTKNLSVKRQKTPLAPAEIVKLFDESSRMLDSYRKSDRQLDHSERLLPPHQTSALLGSGLMSFASGVADDNEMNSFSGASSFAPPYVISKPIIDEKVLKSDFQNRILAPKLQFVAPVHRPLLVPYASSVTVRRHKCVTDAGCFHGRRFRVGFASEKRLLHVGAPISSGTSDATTSKGSPGPETFSIFKAQTAKPGDSSGFGVIASPFQICVEQIQMAAEKADQEYWLALLECQLSQSDFAQTGCGCPQATPIEGLETLYQYAELPNTSYAQSVWELCIALWGKLPEFEDFVKASSERPYAYQMSRKRQLSAWLSNYSKAEIDIEVERFSRKGPTGAPAAAFSLLTGHRIADAARCASKSGDVRTSLIIASSAATFQARAICSEQLVVWHQTQADGFITADRMKLFVLLGGCMCWETSNKTLVNVCEELDWMRCLGLHMWYYCHPSAPISSALQEYELAFSGSSTYGVYASPPHYSSCSKYDLRYHLLKLFVDRSHSFNALLNPCTYAANEESMDFHLSWHVWCILDSIGYGHINAVTLTRLHLGYANQLIEQGLWLWAAFVLCHVSENEVRETKLKELLSRYVDSATEDDLRFLREQLHVPDEWIFESKALLEKERGQFTAAAWYCLKAGNWNLAHNLFLEHIAPQAVADDDLDELQRYLEKMEAHSDEIQGWSVGGLVYFEHLRLCREIELLKRGAPTVIDLDRHLRPIILSLASRLESLSCEKPIQRLAQGEMAKRVACLMRILTNETDWIYLTEMLNKLPMPDDYLLDEIQKLSCACIQNLPSQ